VFMTEDTPIELQMMVKVPEIILDLVGGLVRTTWYYYLLTREARLAPGRQARDCTLPGGVGLDRWIRRPERRLGEHAWNVGDQARVRRAAAFADQPRGGAAPVKEVGEVVSRGEPAVHLRGLKNDLRSLSTHRVTVSYRSAPRAQRASARA